MNKVPGRKINRLALGLVILTITLGLTAANYRFFAGAQNQEEAKFNQKTDKIVTPSRQDLVQKLTLAGSIDAATRSDVRFQTSGLLSWVGVKVGDRVKKWQAIASLDRRELQKQLDKEFNDYRTALHNFDDTHDQYKPQRDALILTDEMKRILDRSQFTLNNAVIDYELADLAKKYATIVSPIAGVVVALDQPVAGVNITPATSTFTVVDPQSIYFKSNIDEEEIQKISLNQETEIILDSYPDKPIKSKITYISFAPVAGESTTVYEVRYDLGSLGTNSDLTYRLGMSGDANIVTGSAADSLTIPVEALMEDDDQNYVWLKQDNKVIKKPVKTGLETSTDVQVLEGISQSDQVVIRGR